MEWIIALFAWFIVVQFWRRRKHQIREAIGPVYFGFVAFLIGGWLLDVLINITIGTVVFLELPKTTYWPVTIDTFKGLTLSRRLKRYRTMPQYTGWRVKWADYICETLLNPYDAKGSHC